MHRLNPRAVRNGKSLGDAVGMTDMGIHLVRIKSGDDSGGREQTVGECYGERMERPLPIANVTAICLLSWLFAHRVPALPEMA
jgi:hypothetical protein